jgi:hypothetical protein
MAKNNWRFPSLDVRQLGYNSSMRSGLILAGCLVLITAVAGCADDGAPTTQPASAYERSENALKDPFGYSPNVAQPDDITGGPGEGFDRKAFNKDANDVLNP